ncbi:hypothetical protein L6V77_19170 [Myxococcota bacterium]|nr:hypothetical protein [Myxococcota bacterium]
MALALEDLADLGDLWGNPRFVRFDGHEVVVRLLSSRKEQRWSPEKLREFLSRQPPGSPDHAEWMLRPGQRAIDEWTTRKQREDRSERIARRRARRKKPPAPTYIRRPPPKKKGGIPLWAWGAGGGALLLIIVVVMMNRRRR